MKVKIQRAKGKVTGQNSNVQIAHPCQLSIFHFTFELCPLHFEFSNYLYHVQEYCQEEKSEEKEEPN